MTIPRKVWIMDMETTLHFGEESMRYEMDYYLLNDEHIYNVWIDS
jgi:hypothetical protein